MAAFLDQGVSIETRNARGWTPLIGAVHAGQTAAVRLLLARRANPNTLSAAGCSPLDFAVGDGHEDIVSLLLDAGADPNGFRASTPQGHTTSDLYQALQKHHPAIAERLLAHGARIDDRNNRGFTVLMEASMWPYADQIALLIRKGANVNVRGPDGHTALILAAYNGCDENVRLLIDHGADVQATAKDDPDGKPYGALEVATEQGRPYVLEALADAGARPANPLNPLNEELNLAIGYDDYERVQAALAKGASATQADSSDVLPLTVAVMKGDPGIVQMLIKAGADVNANPGGDPRQTMLHHVEWGITHAKNPQEKEGYERVAELLRKAGATR